MNVADLITRAQITLLADLLQTDTASLMSLQRFGARDVEALRASISANIFDSLSSGFARISKLAPIMPNALVVAVAQKAVPPEVAGRVGGALGIDHEDRTIDVLAGMKPTYLADAARYIDPRIIPYFAPKLPAHLLVPTAKELLRRNDYLTASMFVEHATGPLIVDFEKALDDDEGLIRASALVSNTHVINEILRVAGPARLSRMASRARTGNFEFIVAMLSVLARIDPGTSAPAVDELLGSSDTVSAARIIDCAETYDALSELLDLSALLGDERISHLASALQACDEILRQAVHDAADTAGRKLAWKRIDCASRELPAQYGD